VQCRVSFFLERQRRIVLAGLFENVLRGRHAGPRMA
jgi:hypothetical protein